MSALGARVASNITGQIEPISNPAWLYVPMAHLNIPVDMASEYPGPIQPISNPAWLYVPMAALVIPVGGGGPPVYNGVRVTQAGDTRITQAGDTRITQQQFPS